MKVEITLQILILAVMKLATNQNYASIAYISLALISIFHLLSIHFKKHSTLLYYLVLTNLVVSMGLTDESLILETFILAQDVQKFNIVLLIVSMNLRFIRNYSIEEIVAQEAILAILIVHLYFKEKQKQEKQPKQDNKSLFIQDDHSQLMTQSLNFHKDFFKNIINLIPNGILVLLDRNTIQATNQQIGNLFPNLEENKILQVLLGAQNCRGGREDYFERKLFEDTQSENLNFSTVDTVGEEIDFLFESQECQNVQFSIIRTSQMFVKINQNAISQFNTQSKASIVSKLPDQFFTMYLDLAFILYVEDAQVKLMVFVKDVSSQNRVNLLRKLNRNKSKLLRNVCHEIRNPVSAISLMTEAMKQDDKEMYKKYGEDMQLTLNLLLSLLNDLLDVAQVNSGKFSLIIKQFNVNKMLHDVNNMMRYKFKGQNVELEINCQVEILNSDENRVRQVLINLLSNSLKFTKNGQIKITISRIEDDLVEFQVIDTGIGIKQEEQQKLFRTFGRLETSQAMNPTGVGLGLHISQVLCRKLNDSQEGLKVYSEGEGKGTTFTFKVLDHVTSQLMKSDIICQSTSDLQFGECECLEILIVDDQEFNLSAARMALKKYRTKVDTATSGQEAYEKIMTYQSFNDCICRNYRIVLLDLEMPEMDGYETAKQILFDFPNDDIQIIGCSGFSGEEILEKCQDAGMAGYIQKPITLQKLRQLMKETARKS